MSKLKVFFLVLLGPILAIILVGFIVLTILGKDEPKPDNTDLMPSQVAVLESENAAKPLLGAYGLLATSSSELKNVLAILDEKGPWSVANQETVKIFLQKNKDFYAALDKALQYSRYQDEDCKDIAGFSTELTLHSGPEISMASNLLLLRAKYLFNQGQEQAAFEDVFKDVNLGHMVEIGHCHLTFYLLGSVVKWEALSVLREFIDKTSLPSAALKLYSQQLAAFKDSREGLIYAFKLEYLAGINTFKKYFLDNRSNLKFDQLGKIGYFLKSNKTQRIMGEHWRQIIANIQQDFYKDKQVINPDSSDVSPPKGMYSENRIGRLFLQVVLVTFPGAEIKMRIETFSVSAARTLLALKSYWQDNQKLPDSLAELVPDYLSEVPKDSFDGQPIRYSKAKKIIYSVGEDLKNEGGSPEVTTSLERMPDPTIKIGF